MGQLQDNGGTNCRACVHSKGERTWGGDRGDGGRSHTSAGPFLLLNFMYETRLDREMNREKGVPNEMWRTRRDGGAIYVLYLACVCVCDSM